MNIPVSTPIEDLTNLGIYPNPKSKTSGTIVADTFEKVTVLFGDIVKFTEFAASVSANELVYMLNEIFSEFDRLAEYYGLEKIKTIGDSYMVVGGLPIPRDDHAEAIAEMSLAMQESIGKFLRPNGQPFQLRIGIHSGQAVAGVIGKKKFIYDIWGDTVNIASRMESSGIADCIQVTQATYRLLNNKYLLAPRNEIMIKGKGKIKTYLLTGKKESSIGASGN
jgi:class 3 adenylate cyclase